jgi:hypothetical protein
MDRPAIARAQRRREGLDALEFERSRAAALRDQLEEIVAELEGPRVDEETFGRMAPEDVELVRSILTPGASDEDAEEEWLAPDDLDEAAPDGQGADEEEIARLAREIEESERRQQALERYLQALGD